MNTNSHCVVSVFWLAFIFKFYGIDIFMGENKKRYNYIFPFFFLFFSSFFVMYGGCVIWVNLVFTIIANVVSRSSVRFAMRIQRLGAILLT